MGLKKQMIISNIITGILTIILVINFALLSNIFGENSIEEMKKKYIKND